MTLYNEDLIQVFQEELMDGFAEYKYGNSKSTKSTIRRIESLEEYNEVINRVREPRGIITGGQFYLQNFASDIIHSTIVQYLKKKGIITADVYPYFHQEYIEYEKFVKDFICVHVGLYFNDDYDAENIKYVLLGESYDDSVERDPNIDEHFAVLDRLGIPYKKFRI